ncbi:MAG: aminotransferase class I/II-fold pyridoxal phosphate-dependent enzyme [Thermomicrobiales bacterium]
MRPRPGPIQIARQTPPAEGPIRLNLLANPYGPSIRVQEALASADDLHLPQHDRQRRVQERLAAMVGLSPTWLVLANGIDDLYRRVLIWQRERSAVVTFPPTDATADRIASQHDFDVRRVGRTHRFTLDLEAERGGLVPEQSIAVVMSPNEPTGTELSSLDAVRLSRICRLVVIDERHGEYGARTLVPLAREFDNLIVARSMETWAALAGFPLAFAVAPPRIAAQLAECGQTSAIPAGALIAAEATLDDIAYMRATVQRVREEKARLYRMLRKLNMVRPVPSWANFLLARVERGNAGWFHRELADRSIYSCLPDQAELDGYLRLSASRPEHTLALKHALIEIATAL